MKRTLLILMSVACCASLLTSQNPSYRWLRDAGLMNNMFIKTPLGQNGDVFALMSHPDGIMLERYDSTGSLHWSRQIPNVWYISTTYNNEVLLSGNIVEPVVIGTTTLTNAPKKESLLLKLDQNGNVLSWANYQNYYTLIHDMESTPSGDIYVKGYVGDTMELKGYTIVNPTSKEFTHFVMKLNANLVPQWHYFLNVGPKVNFGDLVVHNSKVFLTGGYEDTIAIENSVIYAQPGTSGSFILRLDDQGQVNWHKALPGTTIESLQLDAAGNFYLRGTYGDTLVVGSKSITSKACNYHDCTNDFFLKMDSNGNPTYLTAIGQDYNSSIFSSAVTPAGRVYFTGTFVQSVMVGADSIYVGGPWNGSTYLAALDENGELHWSLVPEQQYAVGTSVSTHANGSICWAGFARKIVMQNDSVQCPFAYQYHHFISRFQGVALVNTNLKEPQARSFAVWPNPAHSTFNITGITDPGRTQFTVFDMTGACVKRFRPGNHEEKISTENMSPGVYLIVSDNGIERKQAKLLVE